MKITLQNTSRRFNQEWIFKNIDYTFSSSKKYAILGPNGSGKSTLLKVLAGHLSSSAGQIAYELDGKAIDVDTLYKHITIAAPYVELIEEFSLREMLAFHFRFKQHVGGFDNEKIIQLLHMEHTANKSIRHFSSGMKQRVKLALACCSQSQIVILDEPTSNMDNEGLAWYLDLLETTITADRLLLIGSNQEQEYSFCDQLLTITDYK